MRLFFAASFSFYQKHIAHKTETVPVDIFLKIPAIDII